MKPTWFIAGVLCTIVYATLRLVTLDGASPVWAAILRPVALVAAFLCLMLANQRKFTLRDIRALYTRQAQTSLVIGLLCLVLIPIALYFVYIRYYSPLLHAVNENG